MGNVKGNWNLITGVSIGCSIINKGGKKGEINLKNIFIYMYFYFYRVKHVINVRARNKVEPGAQRSLELSLKFLLGAQRCTVSYTQHLYVNYEYAIRLPGEKS